MPQQDFNTAERQAIMRAKEMYRRATMSQNGGEPIFQKRPASPQLNRCPPPPKPEPKRKNESRSPGAFFDGDMKIIIAMMLLLSGDGGDTLLLLALMYIML